MSFFTRTKKWLLNLFKKKEEETKWHAGNSSLDSLSIYIDPVEREFVPPEPIPPEPIPSEPIFTNYHASLEEDYEPFVSSSSHTFSQITIRAGTLNANAITSFICINSSTLKTGPQISTCVTEETKTTPRVISETKLLPNI